MGVDEQTARDLAVFQAPVCGAILIDFLDGARSVGGREALRAQFRNAKRAVARTICGLLGSTFLATACARAPTQHLSTAGSRLDLTCDTATVGGTISGRVLFEPDGRPIRSHGVTVTKLEPNRRQPADFLHSMYCMAVTDSAGRFVIRRVPPGRWEVRVANGGYHRAPPVPVQLQADSVAEVEFRLRPENMVADCLEEPACQNMLVPPPRLASADDTTRLQLLGYALAIAFAGGGHDPNPVACIGGAALQVMNALRARYSFVVPDTTCERPSGSAFLPGPKRMLERSSRRQAFLVGSSRIELRGDTAVVRTSYYVGPLWALGWRCRFLRRSGDWLAIWCGVEWIS